MALFKPFMGSRTSLDAQPLHDGYAYFCTDDGSFHIDFKNVDGKLQRKQLNANNAESLVGMSLDEIQEEFRTYADNTNSSHNTSTDAHANMGWLSSGDEIAGSPIPVDADTLNGRNAAYFDNQIAVERARINQFVALEDGSTTGDAELQDIRVGYDGTTYESAGDAVRGQFRKVSERTNVIADGLNEVNGLLGLPVTIASGTAKAPATAYEDTVLCDEISLEPGTYVFYLSVDTNQTTKKAWAYFKRRDGTNRQFIEINLSETTDASVTLIEAEASDGYSIVVSTSATEATVSAWLEKDTESDFVKRDEAALLTKQTVTDEYSKIICIENAREATLVTNTGKLISGKIVVDSAKTEVCVSDPHPVIPGEWIEVTASAGWTDWHYVFYDANGSAVAGYQSKNESANNQALTAKMICVPANAATIVIAWNSTVNIGKIRRGDVITNIGAEKQHFLSTVSIDVPSVMVGYLNHNGVLVNSASYTCTDFVPYDKYWGAKLTLNCTIYDNVALLFFDESKNIIKYIVGANAADYDLLSKREVQSITVDIPEGTRYIRASYLGTANTSSFDMKTVCPGKPFVDATVTMTNVPAEAEAVDKLFARKTYIDEHFASKEYLADIITGDVIEIQNHTDTVETCLKNGAVIYAADTTYFTTNDIPVEPSTWYKVTASAGYSASYYAILDVDKNILVYKNSPGGSGTAVVNKMVFTPENAAYIRVAYISTLTGAAVAKCISIKAKENLPSPWAGKFLAISYSHIGVACINTLETYISAGHFGFNVCKGDVRPTSDGKLIMCHDSGFTFDANGRITNYDSANATLIRNLTYAECMEYEYSGLSGDTEHNHYQKVCDFDQYLDVCKQYGMTAFVTIRDEYMDVVVPEMLQALKAHEMLGDCIINSYTVESLTYVRCLDDIVPLSIVRGNDETLSSVRINMAKAYGRCALTLVSTSNKMRSYIANNASGIALAHENGVGLMYAQPLTMEDVEYVRENGFTGAQIGRPVMPYNFTQYCFKVNIENGTASVVDWFGMTRFTANISAAGNVVSISNFKIAGSTRGFNDYIMEYWMNKFPHRISVISENGNTVTAKWRNNAVEINTADISVDDVVSVIVEV